MVSPDNYNRKLQTRFLVYFVIVTAIILAVLGGTFYFNVRSTGNPTQGTRRLGASPEPNTGQWYYVVGVFNWAGPEAYMYIDGNADWQNWDSTAPGIGTSDEFRLGSRSI